MLHLQEPLFVRPFAFAAASSCLSIEFVIARPRVPYFALVLAARSLLFGRALAATSCNVGSTAYLAPKRTCTVSLFVALNPCRAGLFAGCQGPIIWQEKLFQSSRFALELERRCCATIPASSESWLAIVRKGVKLGTGS